MIKRERIYRQRYHSGGRTIRRLYIERFHNPRMQRRIDARDQAFMASIQQSAETGWNPQG